MCMMWKSNHWKVVFRALRWQCAPLFRCGWCTAGEWWRSPWAFERFLFWFIWTTEIMPRRSRRREKPMGLDSRHIGSTRHTRSAESRVSRSMVFLLCSSAYTSLVKPLFKRVWCLLAWLIENVQLAITVVCCGAFLLALHLYSFLLLHISCNLLP